MLKKFKELDPQTKTLIKVAVIHVATIALVVVASEYAKRKEA